MVGFQDQRDRNRACYQIIVLAKVVVLSYHLTSVSTYDISDFWSHGSELGSDHRL